MIPDMKSAFGLEIFFAVTVKLDGEFRQFIVTNPDDLRKILDPKIISRFEANL